MPRRFQFSLIVLAVVALEGCGPAEPARTGSLLAPGVFVDVVHPYTSGVGSRGHQGSANEVAMYVVYWKGGQVEIVIDHLHLIVEGRDYGTVQSGDQVVVDATASNTVQVNGQMRQPGN